jgi:hypothetical protein
MKSRTKVCGQLSATSFLVLTPSLGVAGYEVAHDYSLITVFSASRYCGKRNNFGAFVVFADKSSLTPQFHRFMADDLDLLTAGTHWRRGGV